MPNTNTINIFNRFLNISFLCLYSYLLALIRSCNVCCFINYYIHMIVVHECFSVLPLLTQNGTSFRVDAMQRMNVWSDWMYFLFRSGIFCQQHLKYSLLYLLFVVSSFLEKENIQGCICKYFPSPQQSNQLSSVSIHLNVPSKLATILSAGTEER